MMSIFGFMIFGAIGQTLFLDWVSLVSGNITPQIQMRNACQPSRNNVIACSSVVSLQEQRKHLVALPLSPPIPPDFSVSTYPSSLGFPPSTLITHEDHPEKQRGSISLLGLLF